MPPKKEKVEKTSVEAGTALVLEYLKQQNRPYSTIDISANLHNKVTKTQAAKILKDLADTNQIATKASGKQSIYHAIQDSNDNLSVEELAKLDEEITSIRNEIIALKDEEKAVKSELSTLRATVSLPELQAEHASLDLQKNNLQERLDNLKTGTIQAVSVEDKIDIEKSLKLWTYKVLARKKGCMELWNTLSENLPEGKSKDELWEGLGLEIPADV